MKFDTKKIVVLALLLALGLILSYLETLLPPIVPIPGFKLGFSQIAVLLSFMAYSIKESIFISLGKTILSSLVTGTFFTFMFWVSISGAILSLLGLYIAKRLDFSIYSTSIFSAVGHNVGQLLFVGFSLSFSVSLFYLPYVLIASLITGFLIGYVCKLSFSLLERRLT